MLFGAPARAPPLFHEPAVADDHGLTGQCVGLEAGEEQHRLGDVFGRGEFAVNRVLQHDVLDYVLFADAEFLGLLGNLLVDQRGAHKAGADHRTRRPDQKSDKSFWTSQLLVPTGTVVVERNAAP